MRPVTRGYMQAFQTRAEAQLLWRALTEPRLLAAWLADEAQVEPRVGGLYEVRSKLFGRRVAHIERFDPGSRLQLLHDPQPDWPELAEGALLEDFIIDARDGVTTLRVIGSGIPGTTEWLQVQKRLRAGWAVALGHLQRQLSTGKLPEAAA